MLVCVNASASLSQCRLLVALRRLQVVHTLTGHTNAVSCVTCSPMEETTAVSAGEDRCLKVNDKLLHVITLPCDRLVLLEPRL